MSTLESRIAAAVGRVVTNVSNWPDAVAPHMLGRDLAEPIDKIAAALAPVIAEAQAEALLEAVSALNEVVEDAAAHGITNGLAWQTGALAMRDQLKIRADKLVTE